MITNNKSIAGIVTVFLILLFSSGEVKATHAMGSDITYKCLGPGTAPGSFLYEISLSFYRDCAGIPVTPLTGTIDITNTCGFPIQSISFSPIATGPTQITPICPSATSTCNGGIYTGIQEWIYRDTVTLPGECSSWTFSHTEAARNDALTTIYGGDNLYVYSTLNNTNGICNNSPTFSNKPVPFACVGQPFTFNHGAKDVEGDSLVYQLITPRNGPLPINVVNYFPNYSSTQPLISVPPMTFSSATGSFRMNPVQSDVTVLAVLVNEYRNGILIGQIERDIQITALACSNTLPSLTGIDGAPYFSDSVCAGSQLCFFIRSVDPDGPNTTSIKWDQTIPGATLATFGGHRDSAAFCWTPVATDVNSTPYCFTATVSDDNCPYIGVQVYTFCVKVKGVGVNAGTDQTITCGTTTTLSGSATGGDGNYSYTWNPGGINSQQLNNVGLGEYYLTASSEGCSFSDTVQVLPGLGVPSADFSFTNNCSGAGVPFIDNSVVAGSTISSWLWDFGDGITNTTQNPMHQFGGNGTYTVTLTVSTPTNCTSSITHQVTVNTSVPSPAFSSQNVCEGSEMFFMDLSSGGTINSWTWTFNDLPSGTNTSSVQHPSHIFSSSGTYSVILHVTNTNGCQNQVQQNVTVYSNPIIFVSDEGICENSQATLIGPAGYTSYKWNNNQSTQSIVVKPLVNQSYTLTVTDAKGCKGSYTANVYVDPAPTPDAGISQTICEGTDATLSGTGGNSYTWNPGNLTGQNVIVSPSVTTIYSLTVSSNTGCSSDTTVVIFVNPTPTIILDNDVGICDGETININSVTGMGSILWSPGNQTSASISVRPLITTTYTLEVTDAIGCSNTDSITITVNPIPLALISNPKPACGANTIQFADGSSVSSGTIRTWFWDFGNGLSSTSQNPSTFYNTTGNFNVSLLIISDGECRDSVSVVQTVWASPNASFTHTDECDGNPISFLNSSGISDGTILSYYWDLGDNFILTDSTFFIHQYSTFGKYSTALYVTSVNGCVDSSKQEVNVYPYPQADFVFDFSCEDQPSLFSDATMIPQGILSSWYWTFGDDSISSEKNPNHTFSDPGYYSIEMFVTSDGGCKDSINRIIRVVPKPIVDFETENACLGKLVNLTDHSQAVTGSIVQYQWEYGDGSSGTDQNPQHVYITPGFFQISLTATTDSGCFTTLSRPNAVNIFPLPDVIFTSNASNADDIYPEVTFTNETVSPALFYWTFGDNDTSTKYSPIHLYHDVGMYDVQLTVVDLNGCIDSSQIEIEIKPTSNIFIPNSFTPNGDSKNDYFKIYSYNVNEMEVQIYNRLGLKIAEWKGINGSWDGKVDGNPVQSDTYVCRIVTVDINEKEEVRFARVTLVR